MTLVSTPCVLVRAAGSQLPAQSLYMRMTLARCGSCPPPDEASAFHPCRSTLLVYAHSVYNTCAGRMRRLPSTLA
eukprot:65402-Pelagomonas_calceolata.AAC.4